MKVIPAQGWGEMMGMAQDPEADLELVAQDERPDRQEDVVERDTDDGGYDAAPGEQRDTHGAERLESENRKEAEKDADRGAPRNGMWCVLGIQKFMKLPYVGLDAAFGEHADC